MVLSKAKVKQRTKDSCIRRYFGWVSTSRGHLSSWFGGETTLNLRLKSVACRNVVGSRSEGIAWVAIRLKG